MDSTDTKPGASGRDQHGPNSPLNSAQFYRDRIDDLERMGGPCESCGMVHDSGLTGQQVRKLIDMHKARLAELLRVN